MIPNEASTSIAGATDQVENSCVKKPSTSCSVQNECQCSIANNCQQSDNLPTVCSSSIGRECSTVTSSSDTRQDSNIRCDVPPNNTVRARRRNNVRNSRGRRDEVSSTSGRGNRRQRVGNNRGSVTTAQMETRTCTIATNALVAPGDEVVASIIDERMGNPMLIATWGERAPRPTASSGAPATTANNNDEANENSDNNGINSELMYERLHECVQIESPPEKILTVSASKLVSWLKKDNSNKIALIDIRYPYEYEGGHIKGSINVFLRSEMVRRLFHDSGPRLPGKTLVFYQEFTPNISPLSLFVFARRFDRLLNRRSCISLYYPKMYILVGGYRWFYKHYKHYCYPQAYRSRRDKNYVVEKLSYGAAPMIEYGHLKKNKYMLINFL